MKKYELTTNFKIDASGIKMYQIKALKDFGDVKKGDLGGYIEREENLSQDGNSWVAGSALVSGSAKVSGNALICGSVLISGSAKILGNALVCGNAKVSGNALICGSAKILGNALVCGNAKVSGNALVSGSAKILGNALVCGSAEVSENALVSGSAKILGNARISWCAKICNNADYAIIQGFGREFRNTTFFRCNDGEVRVSCGCFFGTIDQFRQQVRTTRDGKIAQEYLKIADLMELHFE